MMGKVRIHIDGEAVELRAHVVGDIAIHRPAYRYMRDQPVTFGKTGWGVSHATTGGSLNPFAPKGPRGESLSLRELKAWAADVQARDPDAWAEAGRLAWGVPTSNPDLGQRLLATLRP